MAKRLGLCKYDVYDEEKFEHTGILCMDRDTPLTNGYSPSQLLCNRSMKSMDILPDSRIDLGRLREFENSQRGRQSNNYNRRHATKGRSPIAIGQKVITKEPHKLPTPASVVATKGREVVAINKNKNLLRRNRSHVFRADKIPKDNTGVQELGMEGGTLLTEDRRVRDVDPETLARQVQTTTDNGMRRENHQSIDMSPNPIRMRSGRVSKPVSRLYL